MIQLDKCPICGSAAMVDRETHALPRVVCIGCGLSTRHVFEEGLAEVWNNRSPLSDPTPLTLGELRGMDGEPVYCVIPKDDFGDEYRAWGIMAWSGVWNECGFYEANGGHQSPTDLIEKYNAKFYTHKPKDTEVQNNG